MMNKKILGAKRCINVGIIIRLVINMMISVLIMRGYSLFDKQYEVITSDYLSLSILISVIIADTVLTVLWLYKIRFHTVHFVLQILFGWIYYLLLFFDMSLYDESYMDISHMIFSSHYFSLLIVLFVIGIVPFILGATGRTIIKKEESKSGN